MLSFPCNSIMSKVETQYSMMLDYDFKEKHAAKHDLVDLLQADLQRMLKPAGTSFSPAFWQALT